MTGPFFCLCLLYYANCVTGTVRLVGGSSMTEGRVELYRNGLWGTICDDHWGDDDAEVVCRQLGYNTWGASAYSGARFGQGSGFIWLDNFRCSGWESSLTSCSTSSQGSTFCSHSEDAGVSCGASSSLGDMVSAGASGAVAVSVSIPVIIFLVIFVAVFVIVKKKKSGGVIVYTQLQLRYICDVLTPRRKSSH